MLASEGHQLLERIHEFASVVTQRLDTMSFPEQQALARTVLEEVVLCGDTVKLYFKIPLPKPRPSDPSTGGSTGNGGLSNQFDLRSRSDQRVDMWVIAS